MLLGKYSKAYTAAIEYIEEDSLEPDEDKQLCQGIVVPDYIRTSGGSSPDMVIVAVDTLAPDELKGFAYLFNVPRGSSNTQATGLSIDIICALPTAKGVGTLIMNEIKNYAKVMGIKVLVLKSLPGTITYYASRHGFVNIKDPDDNASFALCNNDLDSQREYYTKHTPVPNDKSSMNDYINYLVRENLIDADCINDPDKKDCAIESGFPMIWCAEK